MAHLVCNAHRRRVHVFRWLHRFVEHQFVSTVHRSDGTYCPTSHVTINDKTYSIRSETFRA